MIKLCSLMPAGGMARQRRTTSGLGKYSPLAFAGGGDGYSIDSSSPPDQGASPTLAFGILWNLALTFLKNWESAFACSTSQSINSSLYCGEGVGPVGLVDEVRTGGRVDAVNPSHGQEIGEPTLLWEPADALPANRGSVMSTGVVISGRLLAPSTDRIST